MSSEHIADRIKTSILTAYFCLPTKCEPKLNGDHGIDIPHTQTQPANPIGFVELWKEGIVTSAARFARCRSFMKTKQVNGKMRDATRRFNSATRPC